MSESSNLLTVSSSTGTYDVLVQSRVFPEVLAELRESGTKILILADEFFRTAVDKHGLPAIFIEATETSKSLHATPALIEQMRSLGANRQTHLFAIGGGVIQDLASFIASVYMRGLEWSYLPTTVLGMVDSCIGGKSSINVGPYKNLLGTFHPPQRILADPALAGSLPRDQFAGGLIEAAKITFCHSEEAFARHLASDPDSEEALEMIVLNSLTAKKHFIEVDEFDKKERLLLNFGHTFGHALEGASHYAIPHGIAVGLGILCSLAFQRQRGVSFDGAARVTQLESYLIAMVQALDDLRHHLHTLSLDDVLERMASDKKHTAAHYTLILVADTGDVILDRVERTLETDRQLRQAVHAMISQIESSRP
jgi:3-dehydroquinate synthase